MSDTVIIIILMSNGNKARLSEPENRLCKVASRLFNGTSANTCTIIYLRYGIDDQWRIQDF